MSAAGGFSRSLRRDRELTARTRDFRRVPPPAARGRFTVRGHAWQNPAP